MPHASTKQLEGRAYQYTCGTPVYVETVCVTYLCKLNSDRGKLIKKTINYTVVTKGILDRDEFVCGYVQLSVELIKLIGGVCPK